MLTRLINAPLSLQRAAALSFAALVLALLSALGSTAWGDLESRHAEILSLRERAGHMTQIIALKDSAKAPEEGAGGSNDSSMFAEAESLTIGRAMLQGRIEAIAQSNGLQISSAGALPDSQENGLTLVGQRIDFSGTYDAVHSAFLEMETSMPPMLVREASIRVSAGEAGDRPLELAAQIKIFSALRLTDPAPGSAKAAEGTLP
jgi:Type II secretion system (T2SS), protein M subtype b